MKSDGFDVEFVNMDTMLRGMKIIYGSKLRKVAHAYSERDQEQA